MIDDVLPGVSNGPATLSQALVEMENGMTTKIEHDDAIELELLGVKQKLQCEFRDEVIAERRLKTVLDYTREEEIYYGTINDIKFLLEEALIQKSARYNKVQPWA